MTERKGKSSQKVAVFARFLWSAAVGVGKMVSVVTAMITAYKSLKAAQAAATAGQTALNVAMSANPAGAIAAAVERSDFGSGQPGDYFCTDIQRRIPFGCG